MVKETALFVLALVASAAHAQDDSLVVKPTSARGLVSTSPTGPVRVQLYLFTGGETGMSVKPVFNMRWAAEFDLSRIPAGRQVVSATFTTSRWNQDGVLLRAAHLTGYLGNGKVTGADYSIAGRALATFLPTGGDDALDVTDFVKELIGRRNRYAGFRMSKGSNGMGTPAYWFGPQGPGAPVLTLTFAPLP